MKFRGNYWSALAGLLVISTMLTVSSSGLAFSGGETQEQESQTVTVIGTLTDEGAECPALRADDGTLYTLLGNLSRFNVGDRVRVVGVVVEISICNQGITLDVKSIKKA